MIIILTLTCFEAPGQTRNIDPPIVIEILIIFSVFLLLIIGLGTWTWKTK